MVTKLLFTTAFVFMLLVAFPSPASAQDERAVIDTESIPKTGKKPADFVPEGWKIEEQITGDVNDDHIADHLLKLIEDKPSSDEKGAGVNRGRALIIVFEDKNGNLRNAAVADKLLQCSMCGGAFYGFIDTPASVTIEKGVIIVYQDHGSRQVTETTYRFRYDDQPGKFILIGFDYGSRDRMTADIWTDSTNYLTGKRVSTTGKGKRTKTKMTKVTKMRYSIEEVDSDKFDEESTKRLGLN